MNGALKNIDPERWASITHENLGDDDCGVVAIQAVTGVTYAEALAAAKANGYPVGDNGGMYPDDMVKTLRQLGFAAEDVTPGKVTDTTDAVPVDFGLPVSAATFSLTHEYGRFLVITPGHVGALIEGDLFNMSPGNWAHPVMLALQITKEDR